GTVGADGKSVRLVSQLLDAIERGVAWFQQKRLLALKVNALAASVAVRTFGHSGEFDLRKPELVQHFVGCGELTWAAVDQHEVGRSPSIHLASVLGEPAEAPRQHLAHHGVVVAGAKVFTSHVELAVLSFDEAFGASNYHGADRVRARDMAVIVDLDP